MNAELERFFEECRADPWFVAHPAAIDKIEEVFTKIHLEGDDDPNWQDFDDRIRVIIAQKDLPLIKRFEALAGMLSNLFRPPLD